jgi:hypothetical protein
MMSPICATQGDGAGTGHPKRVAQLMPLQQSGSPVLLLLLMHQDYVPAPQALRVIAGAVGAPFQQLCDHMSAEVVAEKGAHVKGFRQGPQSIIDCSSRKSRVSFT